MAILENQSHPGLCGYKAFYNRESIEIWAATSYAAECEAARVLKVSSKKQHLISVVLCVRADGSEVEHSTAAF